MCGSVSAKSRFCGTPTEWKPGAKDVGFAKGRTILILVTTPSSCPCSLTSSVLMWCRPPVSRPAARQTKSPHRRREENNELHVCDENSRSPHSPNLAPAEVCPRCRRFRPKEACRRASDGHAL